MPDKVVHLPRADKGDRDRIPIRIAKDEGECRHDTFDVHETLPIVLCRTCDAVLEPYSVLRMIANAQQKRHWYVEHILATAARMEKRLRRVVQSKKYRSVLRRESDMRVVQRMREVSQTHPDDFQGDVRTVSDVDADGRIGEDET